MTAVEKVRGLARRAADRLRWRRLRVLEWNVKVGRPFKAVDAFLGEWVDRHRPHVVVLLECYTIAEELAAAYGRAGWQVIRARVEHPEARDVVIMVRGSRDVRRREPIVHRLPWVGPVHKRERRGRVFPGVVFGFAGWTVNLIGVHRVPTPSRNAASFEAEGDLLVADVAQIPRDELVLLPGDHNAAGELLQKLADRMNADVVRGHGVDATLVRAPAEAEVESRAEWLGKGGSDHMAVLFTTRIRRRRAPKASS